MKKALSLVLTFVLVVSAFAVLPATEAYAAQAQFDTTIDTSSIKLYEDGSLKSIKMTIEAKDVVNGVPQNYTQAFGRVAVHNGKAVYKYNDNPFIKKDKLSSLYGNDWPSESVFADPTTGADNFIAFAEGNQFEWTNCDPHVITVSFEAGVIDLTQQNTYTFYLWTISQLFGIYIDAEVLELETKNGGLYFGNTELPHQHIYGDATCTAPRTCKILNCGHTVGNPLGHEMEHILEAPKHCVREGNIECYFCDECEEFFADEEGTQPLTLADVIILPYGNHDMAGATCTDPSTCKRPNCGHTVGDPLGHDMEHILEAPKHCVREGNIECYFCDECEEFFADEEGTQPLTLADVIILPYGDHDMADATCISPKTCKRENCGHTAGDPLGHKMEHVSAKPATCTETGIVEHYYCEVCEKTFEDIEGKTPLDNVIEPENRDNHDMADATCTSPKTCKREGCTHEEGEALGHDMSDATCTEAPECQRENCEYTEGEALGHDMSKATCTEDSKCQRKDCDHKGDVASGHDFSGEWKVVKEATTTEEGLKETLCVNGCGEKKIEKIPVKEAPKTGDTNSLLPMMFAMALAAGASVVADKKRREN